MKRKGPFVRDVELHGHHRDCEWSRRELVEGPNLVCLCVELDHDDWVAQGEAEMDRRREEPLERTEDDE